MTQMIEEEIGNLVYHAKFWSIALNNYKIVEEIEERCEKRREFGGDVGSEATYFHLKAYRCIIPQSCGLKIL
jgi:hypothetical protein